MPDAEPQFRIRARAAQVGLALRSTDLTAALSMTAFAASATWRLPTLVQALSTLASIGLRAPADADAGLSALPAAVSRLLWELAYLLLPVLCAPLLSMAVQTAWGGPAVGRFRYRPGWPMASLGSERSAIEGLWSATKLAVTGLVLLGIFLDFTPALVGAMSEGFGALERALAQLAESMLLRLACVGLLLAALDMWVQHHRYHLALHLDIGAQRRERRRDEGDPEVRAQVRRRARRPNGS